MSYKGKFKSKNPSKYCGDYSNIIYRSLLERRVMVMLDTSKAVSAWGSEEIIIPYVAREDNRVHRYFTDFNLTYTHNGVTKKFLIEVKPKSQTKAPTPPKTAKGQRRYIKEVLTFVKNEDKWSAARAWCEVNDYTFVVITEKMLDGFFTHLQSHF